MMRMIQPSLLENTTSENAGNGVESIKKIFTNPVFYIIIGCFVALIILIYVIKRFVKAKPNTFLIVVRRGKVHRILDGNNSKYFLVPFLDSIGGIIKDDEKSFTSDKLFVNDGPEILFKIDYTITYKIVDPKLYFLHLSDLKDVLPVRINDELRLFADKGNAKIIVKSYRENSDVLIGIINEALKDYSIKVTRFKINLIQPLGK